MKQQSKKYLLLILLIVVLVAPSFALAAWWNPFSWGIWNRIFHFQREEQKQEQLIGGDKDSHGCLPAAGYSWCEEKQKCLRTWEEPCETTDTQTAGWKTYTNTEYGFEIKYPNDWSTESQEKNKLTIFCNYDCKIDKNTNDWKCHMCQGLENTSIGAPGPGLNIEVKKISLNDYIKEYEAGKEIFGNNIKKQEGYTLGGAQGVKMIGGTAVGVDMTIIFAEKNNNGYIISYTPMAPIQDQMLSTFKFTK